MSEPVKTTALVLRERWAVDDPQLDFYILMHDAHELYRMVYCEVDKTDLL